MATNLRDRGFSSSMEGYKKEEKKQELPVSVQRYYDPKQAKRKQQETQQGPVSVLKADQLSSAATNGRAVLSEKKFNLTPALQKSYGNYQNYLAGRRVTESGFYSRPEVPFAVTNLYNQMDNAQKIAEMAFQNVQTAEEKYRGVKKAQDIYRNSVPNTFGNATFDSVRSPLEHDTIREYNDQANLARKAYGNYLDYREKYVAAIDELEKADSEWRSHVRDRKTVRAGIDETDRLILETQKEINALQQSAYTRTGRVSGNPEVLAQLKAEEANRLARLESLQNYQKELVERRKLQKEELEWSWLFEQQGIMDNEDFNALSVFDESNRDEFYRMANQKPLPGDPYMGQNLPVEISYMSPDEIRIYNYLVKTQGLEAGREYYDALQNEALNARRKNAQIKQAVDFANSGPVQRHLANQLTTLMAPLKALTYLGQSAEMATTGHMSEDAGYQVFSYLPAAIRQDIAQNVEKTVGGTWGKIGSKTYMLGMSLMDFLFTALISGHYGIDHAALQAFQNGSTTAEALAAGKAFQTAEAISLGIMGTGAAADETIEAKERGLTDAQAYQVGTIAGIAEIFTEKVSIDALFKNLGTKKGWKYIAANALPEMEEEMASDLINWGADVMISGTQSKWQKSIDAYKEKGLSDQEAFQKALLDKAIEIGESGAGGLISGAALGAVNLRENNAVYSKYMRDTAAETERVRQLVEAGKVQPEDTRAFKAAEELSRKLESGETVSLKDAMRAANAINRAIDRDLRSGLAENIGRNLLTEQMRPALEQSIDYLLATKRSSQTYKLGQALLNKLNAGEQITAQEAGEAFLQAEKVASGDIGIRMERNLQPREVTEGMDELERSAAIAGISEAETNRVRNVAKVLGRRVLFEAVKPENGRVENGHIRDDGTIIINAYGVDPVMQVLSHEVTHDLEMTETYQTMAPMILDRIENIDEERARLEKLYGTDNREKIDKELVAFYVQENLLQNERAIYDVVNQNRSFGQWMLDKIDDLLAKLGNENAKERAFLRKARRLYAKALQEKGTKRDGEAASYTGTENDGSLRLPMVSDRYSYTENIDSAQTTTENFKKWFGDWQNDPQNASKIVNPDGTPRVVYHGTNTGNFTVFNPDYIGMSSGDDGFFGQGFYFAYTKGEAGWYGAKRIIPAYLNIKNPFNFQKEIYSYNGERPLGGDSPNAIALINFAEKFPEIAKQIVVYKNSGEISAEEFAKELKDVIANKEFRYEEIEDPYTGQKMTQVSADEKTYSFEVNGEQITGKYAEFQKRFYGKVNPLEAAVEYMHDRRGVIAIPSVTSVILDNNREFTKILKDRGYDGVIQSEEGDEVVAFYPNQIKSAAENVGTFDPNNPDIRYSYTEEEPETIREIMDRLPDKKQFSLTESVERSGDLLALHNLTADKLEKALNLGGFPMPSIAVTKRTIPHTNFGDITLVMNRSTVDPKMDSRNKVFSADVWSPMFPQIEYDADTRATKRIQKKYYELYDKYGDKATRALYPWGNYPAQELNKRGGETGVLEYYKRDPDMKRLYVLDTKGKEVQDVYDETVDRLPQERIDQYDRMIEILGEEVFRDFEPQGTEKNSVEAIPRWEAAHMDEYKAAMEQFFTEKGLDAETVQEVVDNTNRKDVLLQAKNILNYLKNGPEKKTTRYNAEKTWAAIDAAADQKGYEDWLHGLFDGIEKGQGIYNGSDYYDEMGYERGFAQTHYPVTLRNIVRAMQKQNDGNLRNTSGFVGAKTLRGATAREFSSVDQMHDYEDRLRNLTEEEAEQINEGFNDRLAALISNIYDSRPHGWSDNRFIEFDHIGGWIADAAENNAKTVEDLRRSVEKTGYQLDEQTGREILRLFDDISKMPVHIFEGKPQRVVRFDEVMAAVVPEGTSRELIDALHGAGIENVVEYEPENTEDRLAKVNSVPDVAFSYSEEEPQGLELPSVDGGRVVPAGAQETDGRLSLPMVEEKNRADYTEKSWMRYLAAKKAAQYMIDNAKDEFERSAGEEAMQAAERLLEKKPVKKAPEEVRQYDPIESRKRLTNKLLDLFQVNREGRAGVKQNIEELSERLLAKGYYDESDLGELYSRLSYYGRGTIPADPYYESAREMLNGSRLYVDKSTRADFGDDYAYWKKRAAAVGIYFTTDLKNRDARDFMPELNQAFPGIFKEDMTDPRAIIETMVETAEKGMPQAVPLDEYEEWERKQSGRSAEEQEAERWQQVKRAVDAYLDAANVEQILRGKNTLQTKDTAEPEAGPDFMRDIYQMSDSEIDNYIDLMEEPVQTEDELAERVTEPKNQLQVKAEDAPGAFLGAYAQLTQGQNGEIPGQEMVSIGTKTTPKQRGSVKDAGRFVYRKMVDSGEAVSRLGKYSGDRNLYYYYNMARASSNAAVSMIQDAQTNVRGEKVGESLNDIFKTIRDKGQDYYANLQSYLYHMHNIDRMNRENPAAILRAQEELEQFRKDNPEIAKLADFQIQAMANDPISAMNEQAQLYTEILNRLSKASMTRNKPVFNSDVDAEASRQAVSELLNKLENVEGFEEDVRNIYQYIDNLMRYRIESGLITEEDYRHLKEIYPHYVPVFYEQEFEDIPTRKKDKTEIGKTIGRAKGNETMQKIMPLHKSLAKQTFSVVREGSKNRFGTRLLDMQSASKGMIADVQKYAGDFHEDTFDDERRDDEFKKTNTFIVREDGQRWEMTLDNALYEAVDVLSPEPEDINLVTKVIRGSNELFKALCTGYNPAFLVRNFMRDLQDAGLYSKDLSEFAKNYPLAVKEIATNGKYWQQYKALGGLYSSIFDYQTGEIKQSNKFKRYTFDKMEAVNMAVEQAPRLAEFMATVKKAERAGNLTMDTLMEGMYNAADVTVNFGRSGKIGKMLNRNFVPFLNPGIQGFDKMIRNVSETKGFKDWARLTVKATLLGIAPAILSRLLFGRRKDWDEIKQRDKDIYYLFPLDDEGHWLKLPKGRTLSIFGMATDRAMNLIEGKDTDWIGLLTTSLEQTAPANPLTNNIWQPIVGTKLFNPDNPGETWYGTDIESKRLQNLAPEERYDASTSKISKFLGRTFKLSPAKINYLLDQYSGVLGDIILPLTSARAEKDLFTSAFTVDTETSNRLSGDFYEKLDELTYQKNDPKSDPESAAVYKFFNKANTDVSEINKVIRSIEEDENLSDKEKRELTRVQYALRNEVMRNALDNVEEYAETAKRAYAGTDSTEGYGAQRRQTAEGIPVSAQRMSGADDETKTDIAYREANREMFGTEYALSQGDKSTYEKAQKWNRAGVSYDDFYEYNFKVKELKNGGAKETQAKYQAMLDMDVDESVKEAIFKAEKGTEMETGEGGLTAYGKLSWAKEKGLTTNQYLEWVAQFDDKPNQRDMLTTLAESDMEDREKLILAGTVFEKPDLQNKQGDTTYGTIVSAIKGGATVDDAISMAAAGATTEYKKAVKAGLSPSLAVNAAQTGAKIKEYVNQRNEDADWVDYSLTAAKAVKNSDEKLQILSTLMDPDHFDKVYDCYEIIEPEYYIEAYQRLREVKAKYDTDSVTQPMVTEALNQMDCSDEKKGILFHMLNKAWKSTKNNPYDKAAGQRAVEALNPAEAEETQEPQGLGLPYYS